MKKHFLFLSFAACALAHAVTPSVPITRTVNGHALDANVTVTKTDLGIANIATSGTGTTTLVSPGTGTTTLPTSGTIMSDSNVPTSALALSDLTVDWYGDSLTFGTGGTSPAVLFAASTGYLTFNGGVPGETSTQIRTRVVAATGKYVDALVIWPGQNNKSAVTTIKADAAAMIATRTNGSRYILLGLLNDNTSGEWSGTPAYTSLTTYNSDQATLYGSHFIDIRSYLVSQYNASLPQDVIDHGHDVIPSSLRTGDSRAVTIANSTTTATVTYAAHGFSTGNLVQIAGASQSAYNGIFPITVTGGNTFTYTMGSDPGGSATGSPTAAFVDTVHLNTAGYTLVANKVAQSLSMLQSTTPRILTPDLVKTIVSSGIGLGNGTGTVAANTVTATTSINAPLVSSGSAVSYIGGTGIGAYGKNIEARYDGSTGGRLTASVPNGSGVSWYASGNGGAWMYTGALLPAGDHTQDLGGPSNRINQAYIWFANISSALVYPSNNVPANASSNGAAGLITWDANRLYQCTATNTWQCIPWQSFTASVITGTSSLDYSSIAANSEATLTMTVPGASTSTTADVRLGWSAALPDGIVVKQAWVSATNTVSVRVANVTGSAIDPSAVTCRATVQVY